MIMDTLLFITKYFFGEKGFMVYLSWLQKGGGAFVWLSHFAATLAPGLFVC